VAKEDNTDTAVHFMQISYRYNRIIITARILQTPSIVFTTYQAIDQNHDQMEVQSPSEYLRQSLKVYNLKAST